MYKIKGYKTLRELRKDNENNTVVWSLKKDKQTYKTLCILADIDYNKYPYCVREEV